MQIRVENIVKNFGPTQVLRGISLNMSAGEALVLQGASGSGKSTLLYLLGGLDHPTSGSIFVSNKNISQMKDEDLAYYRNRFLGFIFQFHYLLPSMNCLDNIYLPARIAGVAIDSIQKRIFSLAERLEVTACLKKFPYEISGGEQQRINIVRALSLNPPILLCDEPTGNLDSKTSQKVIALIREMSKEKGTTLLIVTHDNSIAEQFPRRILIQDGLIKS
ncbi:MAG: ABC transporter ATP-binding protein [Bacteriovoracaceae bacterium]|nr:ABC transporter ATP-binding protein [Bacteriovoracaceae bacterium]